MCIGTFTFKNKLPFPGDDFLFWDNYININNFSDLDIKIQLNIYYCLIKSHSTYVQYLYSLHSKATCCSCDVFFKTVSYNLWNSMCWWILKNGLISDRQKAGLKLKRKNESTGGRGTLPHQMLLSVRQGHPFLPSCMCVELPHLIPTSAAKCLLLPILPTLFFLSDSSKFWHVRL